MPLNLRAFSRSNSRIDLVWEDNSGNETGFEIRRRVDAGNWELLDTTAAGRQAYRDSTADGNGNTAMYRYDVTACNALGCSMPNLAVIVPFRPVNPEATVDASIKLTWKDNSSNETAFHIERKIGVCTADTPWVFLRSLAPDTQEYTDNGAVPGTTYSYRVQAVYVTAAVPKSRGFSNFSGCVTAAMP